MKKTEEETATTKLRIIMSRHGEGIHNVAGKKISALWKAEVAKIRDEITEASGDTPEIQEKIDTLVKAYKKERDDIGYNLLKQVDDEGYKDPSLTEKGKTQASFSGTALKAYLDEKDLQLSSTAFSSPFERTINSLEEVLHKVEGGEKERFAIPDLMETSGRYVDTYDEGKNYGDYTLLGDGIDVQEVMKGGETEAEVVERTQRGLEKVFEIVKNKEDGLPIVMIHGGVMKAFSDAYFESAVDKIENSDLWDLEISFDASGKFITADLMEKVPMNAALKQEFATALDNLRPSESLLEAQDFSPVEKALSSLAAGLQEAIEKSIASSEQVEAATASESLEALTAAPNKKKYNKRYKGLNKAKGKPKQSGKQINKKKRENRKSAKAKI